MLPLAPAAAEPDLSVLDCAPWPADELVLPLADGELLLLAALPEPEDWLVCAP